MEVLYARLMEKNEAKLVKKLRTIGVPGIQELVPAFEATHVLEVLAGLSPDEVKFLHKLLGGSGAARFILIFLPAVSPVVKNIPLRNADKIRALLGYGIREVKFAPETQIEIKKTIRA